MKSEITLAMSELSIHNPIAKEILSRPDFLQMDDVETVDFVLDMQYKEKESRNYLEVVDNALNVYPPKERCDIVINFLTRKDRGTRVLRSHLEEIRDGILLSGVLNSEDKPIRVMMSTLSSKCYGLASVPKCYSLACPVCGSERVIDEQ